MNNQTTNKEIRSAFFGTSFFSVLVLDELKNKGFLPTLIITQEDKPKGRNMIVSPPPVKLWALDHNVPILQPSSLKNNFEEEFFKSYGNNFDIFIVASYGKILPKNILEIPKFGTLNIHPSLLPKLRGASPLQSAILFEDKTGITIMKMDEEMDHGPILDQREIDFPIWPIDIQILERTLAVEGAKMLSAIIEPWMNGLIKEMPQNHTEATFTKKITKDDGLINLEDDPLHNWRKIQAFSIWPKTYYFHRVGDKSIRVTITSAEYKDGVLKILKVVPEGRKEMKHDDFLRGLRKNYLPPNNAL